MEYFLPNVDMSLMFIIGSLSRTILSLSCMMINKIVGVCHIIIIPLLTVKECGHLEWSLEPRVTKANGETVLLVNTAKSVLLAILII